MHRQTYESFHEFDTRMACDKVRLRSDYDMRTGDDGDVFRWENGATAASNMGGMTCTNRLRTRSNAHATGWNMW